MKISDEEKLVLKQRIKDACIALVSQRIGTAQAAMQQAQESANTEEKSSAGDKHETSRAMSQLDTEMNARQLAQAQRELEMLDKLNITLLHEKVVPGSVVVSDEQVFFIGIGLGNITIDNISVIALSAQAPLAAQLLHKAKGEQFTFRNKAVKITDVF